MARQLTMEERDRIAQLKQQGASQADIARALDRSPSTICRELQRNGSGNEYLAAQAQHRATRRRLMEFVRNRTTEVYGLR